MLTTEPHLEFVWLELPIVDDETEFLTGDTLRSKIFVRADQVIAVEQHMTAGNLCRVEMAFQQNYTVPMAATEVVGYLKQGVTASRQMVERPDPPEDEPAK